MFSQKNRKRRNRKKKKKPQRSRGASSESSGDREKESARSRGSESPAADVEIEYVTEEPEIYEPNFIFFKRIFEAFKVQGAALSRGGAERERGRGGERRGEEDGSLQGSGTGGGSGPGFPPRLPPQLTDDVKKEKEKEPEKLDKLENSAVPKKKGFEEEHKDSDDDSSDDEAVRLHSPVGVVGAQPGARGLPRGWLVVDSGGGGSLWRPEVWGRLGSLTGTEEEPRCKERTLLF